MRRRRRRRANSLIHNYTNTLWYVHAKVVVLSAAVGNPLLTTMRSMVGWLVSSGSGALPAGDRAGTVSRQCRGRHFTVSGTYLLPRVNSGLDPTLKYSHSPQHRHRRLISQDHGILYQKRSLPLRTGNSSSGYPSSLRPIPRNEPLSSPTKTTPSSTFPSSIPVLDPHHGPPQKRQLLLAR